jgi:hypothetical protein
LGEHIPLSLMMYYQITSSIRYKKIQESSNPFSSSIDGRDDDTFFLIMNQQRKKGDGDDEDGERQHTDLNHSLVEVKEVESDKVSTPKRGGFSKIKASSKTPVIDISSLRSSEFGANNNNKESVVSRANPSMHEN